MIQPNKNKKKVLPATRQDSLNVYNNSRQVEKYYKKRGYEPKDGINQTYKTATEANNISYKDFKDNHSKLRVEIENGTLSQKVFGLDNEDYRQDIDKNKYKQREHSFNKLDMGAPMQLFDKRIEPTETKTIGKTGDLVQLHTYNTIANKPFDLLTEKEKAERVKTYGRSGVPDSYGKTKTDIRKPNTTTGKQVKENNGKGMVLNQTLQKKLTSTKPPVKKDIVPEVIIPKAESLPSIGNNEINSSLEFTTSPIVQRTQGKYPKSFEVTDNNNQRFGGGETKYNISGPEELRELPKENWTRIVVPKFNNGGKINLNNNTMKRLPYKKRHIAPSIIAAGIGAGVPLISSMFNKQEDPRDAMLSNLLKEKKVEDAQMVQGLNLNGTNGLEYYAEGGKLPSTTTQSPTKGKFNTTGGELQTLSSSMELAQGNTHGENKVDGQYGITLDNGQEQVAEIEDEEVLSDNQKVFSNRLMVNKNKSFADVAKKIGIKAGKIEKKLENTNDSISRNGYERQLAGTKMAEDSLFALQEQTKQEEGVKELENYMAFGGLFNRKKLPIDGTEGTVSDADMTANLAKGFNNETGVAKDPSLGSYVAPMLMDNIGNLALTAMTPKVPKPIVNRARRINTNVNVNPELASVANSVEAGTSNILQNTSDSNTARNNIASLRLRGLESRLGILGDKDNRETQLKNADLMNVQNVEAGNNALRNDFTMNQFQRKNDINSQISANLADVSKNIGEGITNKQMDKYYDEVMLLDLLDDPTGEKVSAMDKNPYFKNGNRPKLNEAIQAEALRRRKNKRYDFRLNPNISPTIKFE